MFARSSRTVEPILTGVVDRIIPPNGSCRLLEAGCGSGVYTKRACDRNPDITVVGLDLQRDVIDFAKGNALKWNIADRATFRYLADEICPRVTDPCLELVFNLSDPVKYSVEGSPSIRFTGDFIVGALARQVQLEPTGSIHLFGVRFTPGGLYPFLSMPPVDLSDICIDIEEVWDLDQLGASKLIHGTNPTAENLIPAFEGFFLNRMGDFRAKHGLIMEKAVSIIRSRKGRIPVETLARQLDISHRHLGRKFTELIGVPPKQLCRIFRIKNVLSRLGATGYDSASLAIGSGYFDQAHFIRDFKFFTDKSPLRYSADWCSADQGPIIHQ